MFWLVLALLLFIVAVVILVINKVEFDEESYSIKKYALIPFGIGLLLMIPATLRVVDPGTTAVPVTFGTVGSPVGQGVSFVAPWTAYEILSTRTEEYTMSVSATEGAKSGDDSVEVKGADGATGHVDATVLFHVNQSDAGRLFSETGVNYVDKIIRPTARTCIRDAYATYPMIQASTEKRGDVSLAIEDCIRRGVESRGMTIESFQLRNVRVDDSVQKSIDAKVAAQQENERKVFEVKSAQSEADKKRIEAKGVADSEQIIKCGATLVPGKDGAGNDVQVATPKEGASCENNLTPEYLQYQYIQALKDLVDAPNNSTIVIPMNQELAPMINLNQGK